MERGRNSATDVTNVSRPSKRPTTLGGMGPGEDRRATDAVSMIIPGVATRLRPDKGSPPDRHHR